MNNANLTKHKLRGVLLSEKRWTWIAFLVPLFHSVYFFMQSSHPRFVWFRITNRMLWIKEFYLIHCLSKETLACSIGLCRRTIEDTKRLHNSDQLAESFQCVQRESGFSWLDYWWQNAVWILFLGESDLFLYWLNSIEFWSIAYKINQYQIFLILYKEIVPISS